jgi:hypothetical protein
VIIPRECLVRPGIIDSERVCALSLACQLFFRNILHCADGKGRFPADAAEIRHALYYRQSNVASSHVEAWLLKCNEARLVKLYTRDGKRFGEIENYGQRDTKRRTLYPPAEGQEELSLAADPPPKRARPPRPKTGTEEKGRESASAPAPHILSETQEQWLARLAASWPEVNLPKQLRAAEAAQRLVGKDLEREWFETRWLAKTSPVVRLDSAAPAAAPVPPEPANWRQMLKAHYLGESWALSALACTWTTLPGSYRARILAAA